MRVIFFFIIALLAISISLFFAQSIPNFKNESSQKMQNTVLDNSKLTSDCIAFAFDGDIKMKICNDSFYYKDQRVDDPNEVYQRFNEWLEMNDFMKSKN